MSTLQQVREGVSEAWDNLVDGWQRLYPATPRERSRDLPPHRGDKDGADQQRRGAPNAGWGVLTAEVFDDDDKVVVRLEAPGMSRDAIDVHVHDDYLVVSGEKHYEKESTQGRYHVTECAYGRLRARYSTARGRA